MKFKSAQIEPLKSKGKVFFCNEIRALNLILIDAVEMDD